MRKESQIYGNKFLITDLNRNTNLTHLDTIEKKQKVSNFSVLYCNINWSTHKKLDSCLFRNINFVHIYFDLNTFKLFRNIIK